MVHYSTLRISGSILIKICIWIKNLDLDPDYSKIGQIMAFYTNLLVFYGKSGISRSKFNSGHKSGSGSRLQQNRPNNDILGQIRHNNGTLQYVRYISGHPDQNLHLDQKSGSGSRLQQNMPNNGTLGVNKAQ